MATPIRLPATLPTILAPPPSLECDWIIPMPTGSHTEAMTDRLFTDHSAFRVDHRPDSGFLTFNATRYRITRDGRRVIVFKSCSAWCGHRQRSFLRCLSGILGIVPPIFLTPAAAATTRWTAPTPTAVSSVTYQRRAVNTVGVRTAVVFCRCAEIVHWQGRKRRFNSRVLVKSVSSSFDFRKVTSLGGVGVNPVSIAE